MTKREVTLEDVLVYEADLETTQIHLKEARKQNRSLRAQIAELEMAATFLADRLGEFEGDMCDCRNTYREWMGHVVPAMERLKAFLSEKQAGKAQEADKPPRVPD